jgi:hypothetical protein
MTEIEFEDKTFCFTGKMSELKRTMAEREVRSRKGLSQREINTNLDYLVIGSISSPAWKFGDYGNKIKKARTLISEGSKTKIVSEASFMNALETVLPTDTGEIDEKILICRYKALVSNGAFDIVGLEEYLKLLAETENSHVTATIEEPYIYQDLYNEYTEEDIDNLLVFQCRLVKHFPLDVNTQEFIDAIAKGFESLEGVDGDLTNSEKIEGSASYAKLFKEIPQNTSLQK